MKKYEFHNLYSTSTFLFNERPHITHDTPTILVFIHTNLH